MKITETNINDVLLIEPRKHGDQRGFFMEIWNHRTYDEAGLPVDFVQDNHSRSTQGTLRGLHFQNPHSQGKLVRVVQGEVFDVAVDLRRSSSTFGQWTGHFLNDDNHMMMWIPPGFAHGFYVTSEHADFVYKCTDFFNPECEFTLQWDDPEIGVQWPVSDQVPLQLSQKDQNGQPFASIQCFP